MARGPGRIQLKYKDWKGWREFITRLRQQSPQGMANTMARCQALRPSLHELRHRLSVMAIPVLLTVGDEDVPCLETNLMLKSALPNAALWICPNTGHAINLEEPAAFNAQVECFLGAVERGSWRRGYPSAEIESNFDLQHPTSSASSIGDVHSQGIDDVVRLNHK